MNFRSDTVLSENPNFMNFGLSPVNTTDKLGSVIAPTIRVGITTNFSDWLQPWHDIEETKADGVIETKSRNHYNFKSDYETMREIQDFERGNISMIPPILASTPLGTNTTKRKMSPIDSIPVEKKTPDTTPMTQPTELSEKSGKCTYQGTQTQIHCCQTHH